MTREMAQQFVDSEQRYKEYLTSCLQTGKVEIVEVGEDGFLFTRETDYIKTKGVAELMISHYTLDASCWQISEFVTERYAFAPRLY